MRTKRSLLDFKTNKKKTLNKTINPHQAKRIIKLYNTYIFNVNELISPTNTKSTILAT